MAEWSKRIEEHNDVLLHAKTADDFVQAKKEKKTTDCHINNNKCLQMLCYTDVGDEPRTH